MNPVEDSAGVSDLRARLRHRHLQLQAVGSASWPEDLVTATLNDTVTLLNLQERHAAEAAERERVEGARGIRIVAQAGSAVLGIEVTAAFAGDGAGMARRVRSAAAWHADYLGRGEKPAGTPPKVSADGHGNARLRRSLDWRGRRNQYELPVGAASCWPGHRSGRRVARLIPAIRQWQQEGMTAMTISTYDIGRTFTDHARELYALGRTVSELSCNFDELCEGHDSLKRRVSMLETDDIEPIRSSVADLEETTEDIQGELARTRTVVRHLAGRIDWLEHHVRTNAGLKTIAIDEASPALRHLARKADLAANARAGILPDLQRSRLRAQIDRHDNLRKQRQQHLAAAVAHSKAIIDGLDAGDERTMASAAFAAAIAQASRLADQINSIRDDVFSAQTQLDADDEYRRSHSAAIGEGDQAKLILHRKLRQRITDAIGDRVSSPPGSPRPPLRPTSRTHRPAHRTATELIANRITFAIDDRADALGPRPAQDQATRAAWFSTLTAALRNHRQWP